MSEWMDFCLAMTFIGVGGVLVVTALYIIAKGYSR
jgi:hypothetical protein